MKVSGMDEMINRTPQELLAVVKQQHPGLPDSFWQSVQEDIRVKPLRDAQVASYMNHFSGQEIKDLIAWYQMPIGQKFVAAQPAIDHEFSQAQTRWTMGTMRVIRRAWTISSGDSNLRALRQTRSN